MLCGLPQTYCDYSGFAETQNREKTYLRSTPLQTHHEGCDATNAEDTTNVVDALDNVGCSVLGSQTRRIMVAKDAQEKTDEVPDADKDTVVAPVAGFSDELSPQYGGAEGQNGDNDQTDVLATVLDGHDFGCSGKGDEFVETSADSRKDVTSCLD